VIRYIVIGVRPDQLVGAPVIVVGVERGFAHGAGEFGRLVAGRLMASRRQPGNKSLLRSVAPVLGGDASSCDDVVCQRDVACGVDVERRGVHVFVDHDAAVVGVEAGAGVEMDMGVVRCQLRWSTRGSVPRCRTGSLRRDRRRHRRTGAAVARAQRRPSRWARRDWRDRRPPHSRSARYRRPWRATLMWSTVMPRISSTSLRTNQPGLCRSS
jgi:hypothetical protein